MVKIDVEGAELKVLQGAPVTFGRAAPMMLMIDIHPRRIDPTEVCSLLVEYGFSLRSPTEPDTEIEPSRDLCEVLAVRPQVMRRTHQLWRGPHLARRGWHTHQTR
jgi:hypothetical protein